MTPKGHQLIHPRGPATPPGNQISQFIPNLGAFLLVPKDFSYPFYIWFPAKLAKLFHSQMRLGWEQLRKQAEACVFWPPFPSSSSVFHNPQAGLTVQPASTLFLWPATSILLTVNAIYAFSEREQPRGRVCELILQTGLFAPKALGPTPTLICSGKNPRCTVSLNLSVFPELLPRKPPQQSNRTLSQVLGLEG